MNEGGTQFDENGDIVTEASAWAKSIKFFQDELKREAEKRGKSLSEIEDILEGHLMSVILEDDVNVFNSIYAKRADLPMFASIGKNNLLYRLDFEAGSPHLRDQELKARLIEIRDKLAQMKWSEGKNYPNAYTIWKEKVKNWLSDRVHIEVEKNLPGGELSNETFIRNRSYYAYQVFDCELRNLPTELYPKARFDSPPQL